MTLACRLDIKQLCRQVRSGVLPPDLFTALIQLDRKRSMSAEEPTLLKLERTNQLEWLTAEELCGIGAGWPLTDNMSHLDIQQVRCHSVALHGSKRSLAANACMIAGANVYSMRCTLSV